MKRTLIYAKYFTILAIFALTNSCVIEHEGELKVLKTFPLDLTIEFVHNGTNVADSLITLETAPSQSSIGFNMQVSLTKEQDGTEYKCIENSWLRLEETNWGNISTNPGIQMQRICFHTQCLIDNGLHEDERDEIYCLRLKSKKIFNDGNYHTLRIQAHLFGEGTTFNITKIELDGKELTTDSVQVKPGRNKDIEIFLDWEV